MPFSEKKIQDKIGFEPHKEQQEVLRYDGRETTLCCGRRWGKSKLCAYLALKVLLETEKKIWIVSPTYDLSQKVFEYLVQWLIKMFPKHASQMISYRPFPRIKTLNGSILECKSAENPTGLLGEELDLLIVDEASRISKRVYETYLFPTTASRQGKTVFISTPFGKNWFYYKWIENNQRKGSFRFQSKGNPYFPIEEWERARQILPEKVFKQEYLAEFLEGAASVFRGVREIINDTCLKDAVPKRFYVMGVDLGKHHDFTVLTIIDKITYEVVYFDRFKQIDWPLQKARIIAAARRYNSSRVIIDSTGIGDPISDDLKREGLLVDDFRYTNKSKQQLIEKLSVFIEQKSIIIPPQEELIDELESFGYYITDAGNVKYQAPEGLHDDCVNSLALAVWGLQGRAQKPMTPLEKLLSNKEERPKLTIQSFI